MIAGHSANLIFGFHQALAYANLHDIVNNVQLTCGKYYNSVVNDPTYADTLALWKASFKVNRLKLQNLIICQTLYQ